MLFYLILSPAVGAIIIFFMKRSHVKLIKNFSLIWSLFILNFCIYFILILDPASTKFQFVEQNLWINLSNNHFLIGLDGISLLLIILTALLTPICLLLSWNLKNIFLIKEYIIIFLVIESILFGVFSSLDLLIFYILFEAILIPMYFLIGVFGSRDRKIRASYLLFLYTLVSSIVMFISILFLYVKYGTTNYIILSTVKIDPLFENLCWMAFFCSFAVKMPLFPFHIWLPEAHCEAPTGGSVILAGILLKLGGYGFLRYSLILFPNASAYFTPLVFLLSVFGIIYTSISTLQQIDLKKIIAYSSVGHMGLVTIGIFSGNIQGIIGSVFLMISHGVTSGGLFLMIGMLYERYSTRVVKYYGGIANVMPIFCVFFFIFNLANIGLPITSNFIGEVLVLFGCFHTNSFVALFAASGMVFGAGYNLWLVNRILFGNIKHHSIYIFKDLNRKEFVIFFPLIIITFFLGIYPEPIINIIKISWFS